MRGGPQRAVGGSSGGEKFGLPPARPHGHCPGPLLLRRGCGYFYVRSAQERIFGSAAGVAAAPGRARAAGAADEMLGGASGPARRTCEDGTGWGVPPRGCLGALPLLVASAARLPVKNFFCTRDAGFFGAAAPCCRPGRRAGPLLCDRLPSKVTFAPCWLSHHCPGGQVPLLTKGEKCGIMKPERKGNFP